MPGYLLKRHGEYQYIQSAATIGVNRVLRILKPPEDRLSNDAFHANESDYEEWRVTSTETVVQEHPTGGFDDVTILHLERINVPAIPFDQTFILGG